MMRQNMEVACDLLNNLGLGDGVVLAIVVNQHTMNDESTITLLINYI